MPPSLTSQQQDALNSAVEAFGGSPQALADAALLMANNLAPVRKPGRVPASGPQVVELKNVSRTYTVGKTTVTAVDDVTLSIGEGEFVAITGTSGSGKSTLLNLIGGLDRPTSGTLTVAGADLAKLSDAKLSAYRNTTIGFVFQFFYLQPFLNVATNLEVPAMFARLPRQQRTERIAELAEAVGITDRLRHFPRELSGGQMQRVAIARALVNRPKILLADEPTGNLDSANAGAIMDLFSRVRESFGTTVVVITHDSHIAARADRIIHMHDGAAS